jgi:D-alanine-D-alanine ligase
MKKLNEGEKKSPLALIICHPQLVPSKKNLSLVHSKKRECKTEHDVARALIGLGYRVKFCGLQKSLRPLRKSVEAERPEIVFNLCEELLGQANLEALVVRYLELSGLRFTGCGFLGLLLCRQKSVTQWTLQSLGFSVPKFIVGKNLSELEVQKDKAKLPAIVKYAAEDGSLSIGQSSYVGSWAQARKRIQKLKDLNFGRTDGRLMVEEFIEGREFHVTVIKAKRRLLVFRPIETVFARARHPQATISTQRVKWDLGFRRKKKIFLRPLQKSEIALEQRLKRYCAKVFQALELTGYARMDLRLDPDGNLFVIDVNPNPDVARGHEMSENLRLSGFKYREMISLLVESATSVGR